ncbi:non-ribosomal peptide synthetase [Legionella fallonii]|uniref:Amino acid adenylation domain protein n=1 Tax=Legionella fallonii LLAP-10 TaxID=1212491 RepID=A0A098G1I7_9GAMM|nr:amino acid adenylation domain-containing protein [Legionella fallonii]CEG56332.1 Amino acid adenylation domain protein [Legionella fallonii LLAP-10]
MDTQKTIHGLFEEQAKRKPNNIAILYGKYSLTYDELNKKANQLAHYLLAMDIKPDTPIAFCMDRSFECLITILAILKVGAGYLPLDPAHPKERLLFILNNSNTSLLITKSELKEQFTQYQGKTIFLDSSYQKIDKQPTHNLNLVIDAKQLAYVIYTSGSTGRPKGVLIEHQSVVNYAHWFTDYASIHTKQRVDFSSNHTFDMAVTTSIAPLMLGLTIVICDIETKKNLRHYLTHIKSSKINIIKTTPSFFKVLLQEVKNKFIALPYLKTIILGGENLSSTECKAWLKLYPKHILYNEYGPTETTVAVSQYKISVDTVADLELNVPIGTIGHNINCIILDTHNNPVANQEIGELHIGGICLARGYLNQPEITQRQFIPDPFSQEKNARLYKTGDLCLLRDDGVLEYFGRTDSQVKIRGFRIEQGEIEQHLAAHPAINAAVVIAQKDSLNEDRLLAYYILKEPTGALTSGDLREYLQNLIPDFMIPSAFISVSSFPLTANGKLDPALLPTPQLTANQPYRAPQTDVEKTITAIWSEELGVKTIGLDDDFYELGGHSLSAARIISKINRVMGTNISLRDFYFATNIAQLSAIITKTKKRKIIKLKQKSTSHSMGKDIPLSDFQFMLWIADTFESKAKKLNITARKRLQGTLDKAALEFAFDAVLKKQEILFYRILKLKPAQLIQKNLSFKITEIDLNSLGKQDSEKVLKDSMDELISYYPWPKDSPLIIAKLFHLKNNEIELQISIPHIVCDDFSPEILLSDLSQFYLLYKHQSNKTLPQQIQKGVELKDEHSFASLHESSDKPFHVTELSQTAETNKSYKEYIFNEQDYVQKHLDRDICFWDKYMKDAGLFTFSPAHIVKNMKAKQIAFSTYTPIPESTLHQFKQFCARSHMSLNEGLSAAVALALCHCTDITQQQTPYTYVNIIKSTRDNEVYDDIIGCFLRLEPVKIALNKTSTLETITKQIHQSTIDTSRYLQCPDLVKLSAISTFRQKKKLIKNFAINVFTSLYATIFSLPEINRKIFKLCSKRLSSFKRTNHFLININVQKNFISAKQENKLNLFGLDATDIKSYQYDLLQINNVFDVCFIRDENIRTPYLVISANLKPEFRDLIAKEILRIMETATSSPHEHTVNITYIN